MQCHGCGTSLPAGSRFCNVCGEPVRAGTRDFAARKVVTVVFCDVVDSTALGEQLDPESLRLVLSRYFESMTEVIERHGGTVEKYIGDAVMAAFGIPRLHEDDALRAVRAAVEMRTRLEQLNAELAQSHGVAIRCRIGVNTGEIVAGDPSRGEAFATGDAVNVAARLEQRAEPMQIVVGEATYALVRNAVEVIELQPLRAKGKADLLTAYAVLDIHERARSEGPRVSTPLVGRGPELEVLTHSLDLVDRERSARMVAVLGSAGVGKSRLLDEFARKLGDTVTVLRGRCASYGQGVTFWPLAQAVRSAIGGVTDPPPGDQLTAAGGLRLSEDLADRIRELLADATDGAEIAGRLTQVLSSETAIAPQEVFWAARRLLECLAVDRPLVAVFDDVQWAEPLFLDLLEDLVDRVRDAPVLIVAASRPDLLDVRPTWGTVPARARRVVLSPLADVECRELIGHVLGAGELEARAGARVLAATEGNPLFVQEMLALLLDRGQLQRRGSWVLTDEALALPMPPTVEAVLGARIDALPPLERSALQRAAVVGDDVYWGAVEALTPEAERTSVGSSLRALVRRDLIHPSPSALGHQETFRFRHGLIREVAYAELPKVTRAELHGDFVRWLEEVLGPGLEGFEELAGYHLEQAYRLRAELGPAVDRTTGDRAGELLERSGRRAWNTGDDGAATNLLGRAAALYAPDDARRVALLMILADIRSAAQSAASLRPLVEEASLVAQRSGRDDLVVWTDVFGRLIEVPPSILATESTATERAALEAEPILAAAGNDEAVAQVALAAANESERRGRMALSLERNRRAAAAARRAGDTRWAAFADGQVVADLAVGPEPASVAIEEARSMMAQAGSDRPRWVEAAWRLAVVLARTGSYEEGSRLVEEAKSVADELGFRNYWWIDWWFAGVCERLAGDPERALRLYLAAEERWPIMRENRLVCETPRAALLCDNGRYHEALPLMSEVISAQTGPWMRRAPLLCYVLVLRRATAARVLARTGGSREEALRVGREAVALADQTDQPMLRGDARIDLADVLDAIDEPLECARAIDEALAIYRPKGLAPPLSRLRALGADADGDEDRDQAGR